MNTDSIKIIIGNLLSDSNLINTNISNKQEYIRPISQIEIRNRLLVNNIYTIDQYIRYNKLTNAEIVFNTIADTFKSKSMNPHKYFEATSYFVDNVLVNSLTELVFSLVNKNNRIKCIYHIGNRGSGKTITQDILLYRSYAQFEENKFYYVRCDAQRLYHLWRRHILIDNLPSVITIAEYMDIQFLYIFCKYLDKSNLIIKIFKELSDEMIEFAERQDIDGTTYVKHYCAERIKKYHETIILKESYNHHNDYSYAVDEILTDAIKSKKRRAFHKWRDLSQRIQKFLSDKGYSTLFIIDGLDNIDFSTPIALDYYQKMLMDFGSFIKERPKQNHYHLASMRERTFSEIKQFLIETNSTSNYLDENEIFIMEQSRYDELLLGEILNARIEYALNKIESPNTAEFKIINKLSEIIINSDKSSDLLIDDRYHENCRNYLYNKINILKFLYFRSLQDNLSYTDDLNLHYSKLRDESLILNGKMFLDSKKDMSSDLGDFCFNIFHYPDLDNENNIYINEWKGLAGIRILQFLKNINIIRPSYDDITYNLAIHFGYPDELIEYYIEKLRSYGLIDTTIQHSNFIENTEIIFMISHKGKYLLNKIFSSLEILYYFALDTFLPNSIVNEKYIYSHNLDKGDTKYHFNVIKSSFIFIKFLLNIEKNELKYFQENNTGINWQEFYYEVYQLPIISNVERYQEFLELNKSYVNSEEVNEIYSALSITH